MLIKLGGILVAALLTLTLVAVITQATATQQAAQAATVAGVGQTAGTLTVLALVALLVLLLVVGTGAILYLLWRLRRAEAGLTPPAPRRRWAAGPNARWQQQGIGQNPIDTLVQLETLRMLREMRHPAPPPRWGAPPALAYDEDADLPTWGWDA